MRTHLKRLLTTGIAVGLGTALLAGCGGPAQGGGGMVWGTSSVGSNYYNLAVAFSETVAKHTDYPTSVQAVGGSEATVHAIADGKVQLGLSNTFAATNAFAGEGGFPEPVPLRLIAQGDKTLRQLVVRADANIASPADLTGKRIIGERPALPEMRRITDAMLEVYGVDAGSVQVVSTADTDEAIDALKQGTVDGALLPAGVGSAILEEMAETADVRFVDLSPQMDALTGQLGPAFSSATIPAGTYKGQDEDVATPALTSLIVTSDDLPDEEVQAVTEAIFENPKQIASIPGGDEWTAENSGGQPQTIPFHNGAVAYFQDAGVWTDELERTQSELAQ